MKIYVLVEDTKKDKKFESEHGLSIYFKNDKKKFLFDLGQSNIFLKNAAKLNLNLNKIDYLIFSHGHYDHTGGFKFLKLFEGTRVIAHPHCFYPKYKGNKYIGFPKDTNNIICELKEKPTKITKNVYFLGQIPGERDQLGEYIKDNIRHKDFLLDDSALAITDKNRLIIVSGCAHSGIVNIVKYAKGLFKAKEIIVIGGFHMLKYPDEKINKVIEKLKKLNVTEIFPGHCTGENAIRKLLASFKGERLHSGKIIKV